MKRLTILILCIYTAVVFAAADLEILDLKTSFDASQNAIIVDIHLTNHGPQDASHAGVNSYLISNRLVKDRQALALQPIAAGETREERYNISLPPDPIGSIRVEIFDAEQPDITPSTNVRETDLRIPGARTADLEIAGATIVTEQPANGKTVVINVRIINRGPENMPASQIVGELMINGQSVTKMEKRWGRMAADEEKDAQMVIRLPTEILFANATIQLQWMPAQDQVQDPELNNNSFLLPVVLVTKQPDLVPLNVKVDQRGELFFSIDNKGNAPARPTTTALYLNGALRRRYNTPELQPRGSRRHQYGGTKIEAGTQISIVADFNADVPESSEENNRFTFVSAPK